MLIHGFTKTTLLDYPGKVAATIFLGGCNFRCPFCHNAPLVLAPEQEPAFPLEEILHFLEKRRKILDGVCISGGEPTLDPDLRSLCRSIKALGYPIKLDTNGTDPGLLRGLAGEQLIDHIAMDVKSSPEHYASLTGMDGPDLDRIAQSIQWLLTDPLPYEFRTTVVRELHTEADIIRISQWIVGARAYFLQAYQDAPQVMQPGFTAYPKEEMEHLCDLVRPAVPSVRLRGID
ncbi:MAG: anaerobic ribonucleoside-triphosphate reductase activating protein [Lachnospiraceae bacterium]|nr:anaerobic ribonucleoside-triphosphate reductase activating protein [Lachnospiraceae bacterium]